VISLKSKPLALITVLLVATIALSSYAAFASAVPKLDPGKSDEAHKIYNSFTLEATGTATDLAGNPVTITMDISGKANGKLRTVFHLRTQGGDISVEGYEAFSATRGQGIIVNKNNFIILNIMMSAQYYGGRSTVWILRGTTGEVADDTLDVSLQSRRVILPIQDYPQLRNIELEGTITFT
jgi:hypothetical protein